MALKTINKQIRISETQSKTLIKMKQRGINTSQFIRIAIAEKIKRDYKELQVKPKKIITPF